MGKKSKQSTSEHDTKLSVTHCKIDFLLGCFLGQFKIVRFDIEVIVLCVVQSSRCKLKELQKGIGTTNEVQSKLSRN